jgi:hypothetical protein
MPTKPPTTHLPTYTHHQGDLFDRQRLWGSIGWGSLAVLAGLLLDSPRGGYAAGFLVYLALSLPTAVALVAFLVVTPVCCKMRLPVAPCPTALPLVLKAKPATGESVRRARQKHRAQLITRAACP